MIADNLKPILEREAKSEQNALAEACAMEIILLNSLEQQRKSKRNKVVIAMVYLVCYIITGLIILFSASFSFSVTSNSGDNKLDHFQCKAGQMLEQEL